MRIPRPPRPSFMLMASAVCAVALVSGCKDSIGWDVEYTCSGQEQSQAYFDDDTAHATTKIYANSVDFHLRSGQVFLKSSIAPIRTQTDGTIGFAASTDSLWTNGQFDSRSGMLTSIEGRQLRIAGRVQTIHTTGQYSCTARKGALTV